VSTHAQTMRRLIHLTGIAIRQIVCIMTNHIRWYFNVSRWRPTKDDWLELTSSIAKDEVERIHKFNFKDDSKSSLIGCALIRKFLSLATRIPSNEIILERDSHGRPKINESFISNSRSTLPFWPRLLDFNVSHSGDYCVLAGIWSSASSDELDLIRSVRVGVDVTKVVQKKTKQELDRFLSLMSRREFTRDEWDTVEQVSDDRQKCINFTRLWCLKESFIKAIGLGLSFKLQRIDFRFPEDVRYNISIRTLIDRTFLNSTRVLIDKSLAEDWRFLETALDEDHYVALAYNVDSVLPSKQSFTCISLNDVSNGPPFEELSIGSIREALVPLSVPDEHNWIKFQNSHVKGSV